MWGGFCPVVGQYRLRTKIKNALLTLNLGTSISVHALRKEYASESEAERSDYERGGVRKMADAHRKVEGIGPITKDGMPVALRSVSIL